MLFRFRAITAITRDLAGPPASPRLACWGGDSGDPPPLCPSRFHPNSSQSIPTSSQRHPDRDEPLHPNPFRPHPNRSQAICILAELPNLRSSVFICGHSISSFLCGLCVVPLLPSRLRRFRAITAIPAIRTSLCRLSRGSQPLNDKTSAFAEVHNSPAQPICPNRRISRYEYLSKPQYHNNAAAQALFSFSWRHRASSRTKTTFQ